MTLPVSMSTMWSWWPPRSIRRRQCRLEVVLRTNGGPRTGSAPVHGGEPDLVAAIQHAGKSSSAVCVARGICPEGRGCASRGCVTSPALRRSEIRAVASHCVCAAAGCGCRDLRSVSRCFAPPAPGTPRLQWQDTLQVLVPAPPPASRPGWACSTSTDLPGQPDRESRGGAVASGMPGNSGCTVGRRPSQTVPPRPWTTPRANARPRRRHEVKTSRCGSRPRRSRAGKATTSRSRPGAGHPDAQVRQTAKEKNAELRPAPGAPRAGPALRVDRVVQQFDRSPSLAVASSRARRHA